MDDDYGGCWWLDSALDELPTVQVEPTPCPWCDYSSDQVHRVYWHCQAAHGGELIAWVMRSLEKRRIP
jgi:hypothetical protein